MAGGPPAGRARAGSQPVRAASLEGRGAPAAAPRYHPPWPRLRLGTRPSQFMSRGRFYWARGSWRLLTATGPLLFFRRLWGDLVRWPAPGLAPSPGRSWLPAAAAVPLNAFACPTIADRPSSADAITRGPRRGRGNGVVVTARPWPGPTAAWGGRSLVRRCSGRGRPRTGRDPGRGCGRRTRWAAG